MDDWDYAYYGLCFCSSIMALAILVYIGLDVFTNIPQREGEMNFVEAVFKLEAEEFTSINCIGKPWDIVIGKDGHLLYDGYNVRYQPTVEEITSKWEGKK